MHLVTWILACRVGILAMNNSVPPTQLPAVGTINHAMPEPLPAWRRYGLPAAVLILGLLGTVWAYVATKEFLARKAEKLFVGLTDAPAQALINKLIDRAGTQHAVF